MTRVYHNGVTGRAPAMAGPAPKTRDVPGRLIDPHCCDPVDAGMPVRIIMLLVREEL